MPARQVHWDAVPAASSPSLPFDRSFPILPYSGRTIVPSRDYKLIQKVRLTRLPFIVNMHSYLYIFGRAGSTINMVYINIPYLTVLVKNLGQLLLFKTSFNFRYSF